MLQYIFYFLEDSPLKKSENSFLRPSPLKKSENSFLRPFNTKIISALFATAVHQ